MSFILQLLKHVSNHILIQLPGLCENRTESLNLMTFTASTATFTDCLHHVVAKTFFSGLIYTAQDIFISVCFISSFIFFLPTCCRTDDVAIDGENIHINNSCSKTAFLMNHPKLCGNYARLVCGTATLLQKYIKNRKQGTEHGYKTCSPIT